MLITSQERQATFERQAERVQRRLETLSARSMRFKVAQVSIFVAGILVASFSLAISPWIGLVLFIAAAAAIVMLGRVQPRIERSFLKHQALLRLVNAQIARIKLDWAALSVMPLNEVEGDHPFNIDLDITGERSLHQLINTGVSFEGTQLLADWLLGRVPDLADVYQRRSIIRELTPLTRFRNKLMVNALFATRFSKEALDSERLITWLDDEEHAPHLRTSTLSISLGLFALTLVSLLFYIFMHISPLFPIVSLAVSLIWYMLTKKEHGNLVQDASRLHQSFLQLEPIFEYLEKYPYAKQTHLRRLCEPFFMHGDRRPSLLLKKLTRVMNRLKFAQNVEFWFFLNALIPIGAYSAYQLNKYKALLVDYLPVWLDTLYELEALSSLANFAYLNPEYIFPEIVENKKSAPGTTFQAKALGHPLVKKEQKVTNDFGMDKPGGVVMITGSNMAGKSTFLRTVGINLCLAFAGGVVNASSLQTSLFELYACIKVTDSLADGYSYFYAEVRRLRGLLVEIEKGTQFPIFFMIDEIFKGTNNYERLIGSEAYIRALVGKKCVGAISTHDIELVKLATDFSEIKNYHFREEVIDGKMVFDYVLRDGPCPTRNALKIMQLEGLPVQWDAKAQIANL